MVAYLHQTCIKLRPLVSREMWFVIINSSYNQGNYEVIVYDQGFIQDFKLGGAKQDDSSV